MFCSSGRLCEGYIRGCGARVQQYPLQATESQQVEAHAESGQPGHMRASSTVLSEGIMPAAYTAQTCARGTPAHSLCAVNTGHLLCFINSIMCLCAPLYLVSTPLAHPKYTFQK